MRTVMLEHAGTFTQARRAAGAAAIAVELVADGITTWPRRG